MRTVALMIATFAVLAWTPVAGQEPAGGVRIVPTPDGFLEIDGRTGAVRECRREVEGLQLWYGFRESGPIAGRD